MDIDPKAPLSATQSILIDAPVATVWRILTDIERWPEWQSDIRSASLEGALAPGTVFRWRVKGMGITSTLREVEAERRVSWTGLSIGMRAAHRWTLAPEADGTRVTTAESLSGWLSRVLKIVSPDFLEKTLETSLRALQARSEQVRHHGGPAA